MWVDDKQTSKKPIKSGMNLEKGFEEGALIFIFSVITQRASVKNEDGYKRESSSTDCESKQVRKGPIRLWSIMGCFLSVSSVCVHRENWILWEWTWWSLIFFLWSL